eukprot:CFRG2337T1
MWDNKTTPHEERIWVLQKHSVMLDVRGHKIRVIHMKSKSELLPTLFFFHGAGGQAEQWLEQISYYYKRVAIVAMDIVGHGQSEVTNRYEDYQPDSLVEDMKEVFEKYRGRTNLVFAHSYGCSLVTKMLKRLPASTISGLVLCSPALLPDGDVMHRPFRYIPIPVFNVMRLFDRWGGVNSNSVKRMVHASASDKLKLQQLRWNASTSTKVVKMMLEGMDISTLDEYRSIDVPLCIVAGEDDLVTPEKWARLIMDAVEVTNEESEAKNEVAPKSPSRGGSMEGTIISNNTQTCASTADTIYKSKTEIEREKALKREQEMLRRGSKTVGTTTFHTAVPCTGSDDELAVYPDDSEVEDGMESVGDTHENAVDQEIKKLAKLKRDIVCRLVRNSESEDVYVQQAVAEEEIKLGRELAERQSTGVTETDGKLGDYVQRDLNETSKAASRTDTSSKITGKYEKDMNGKKMLMGKKAELHLIADCGHQVMLEKKAIFNAVVNNFFIQTAGVTVLDRLHRLNRGDSIHDKWALKNFEKWSKTACFGTHIALDDGKHGFVPMKVLRQDDSNHSPGNFISKNEDVGVVIDLTSQAPPYNTKDTALPMYIKLSAESKKVPSKEYVKSFIQTCDNYWKSHPDTYIAVHCHYGFNRTGFLLACYLIERRGYSVDRAIKTFKNSRPKGIRHQHFLDELYLRYTRRSSSVTH